MLRLQHSLSYSCRVQILKAGERWASFLTDPCLRLPLKFGVCLPALLKLPGQQIGSGYTIYALDMNIRLISRDDHLENVTPSVKKVTLDSFYQLSFILGQKSVSFRILQLQQVSILHDELWCEKPSWRITLVILMFIARSSPACAPLWLYVQ